MEIETDLKVIEILAKEKEEENWKFRGFLKQLDIEIMELDSIVHQINDEVGAQIDCTECGNCCKNVKPILDKDAISKFASGLKISIGEFREKYLSKDTIDPSKLTFNVLPCPFLEDSKCLNYECRPKVCSSYPYLHKDKFVFRLWGVVDNYSICPIIFNVYERLKSELWYNDYFYEDDLLDF